jgi:hypothetical protein
LKRWPKEFHPKPLAWQVLQLKMLPLGIREANSCTPKALCAVSASAVAAITNHEPVRRSLKPFRLGGWYDPSFIVTAQEAITAKHTKDAKSAQNAPDALFSPFACFAYFAVHSGAPE